MYLFSKHKRSSSSCNKAISKSASLSHRQLIHVLFITGMNFFYCFASPVPFRPVGSATKNAIHALNLPPHLKVFVVFSLCNQIVLAMDLKRLLS